jgi:hypothetical protein
VVFNACEAPLHVEGVEYARWDTMPARTVAERPDVVVAVRDWGLIGGCRLAPLQLFWSLDAFDQPFLARLGDEAARVEIDFLILGSDWQASTFAAHHGVPAWQMLQVNNGTAASATGGAAPGRGTRPRKLAYASTPFRGLDVLLDVFPRIRAACPDAELDVFSSMRVYGWGEAEDREQFGALYEKAAQPGVNLVGTVSQEELAERLQQARVLAYPNHYAETFCIAATEAEAAGCAVVTTALGALPQTVGDGGVCLEGDPRSSVYQRAFVDACVTLLTDDGRWQEMSDAAVARAWTSYTWAVVAEQWSGFCQAALAAEPPVVGRVAAHLGAGRHALAQKMLEREARPEDVAEDVWDALRALVAARTGAGPAPAREMLQRLAIRFRSLRRHVLRSTPSGAVAASPA